VPHTRILGGVACSNRFHSWLSCWSFHPRLSLVPKPNLKWSPRRLRARRPGTYTPDFGHDINHLHEHTGRQMTTVRAQHREAARQSSIPIHVQNVESWCVCQTANRKHSALLGVNIESPPGQFPAQIGKHDIRLRYVKREAEYNSDGTLIKAKS